GEAGTGAELSWHLGSNRGGGGGVRRRELHSRKGAVPPWPFTSQMGPRTNPLPRERVARVAAWCLLVDWSCVLSVEERAGAPACGSRGQRHQPQDRNRQ